MHVVWGVVLVVLSLLCWGGQAVSWLAPAVAARFGLVEDEGDVEAVYWADVRGEAAWDAGTLWTMTIAGVLLMTDSPVWPFFGLVGGGMYLYFSGRGIITRIEMQRRGFRVGTVRNVRTAYALLAIWGVMAAVTIAVAVAALI